MSTAFADPAAMIRRGAPHLIRSEEQLVRYTEALFQLTAKGRLAAAEEEAVALLTLLIERYESERYPVPDASPGEVLRFLLDHNELTQRDIAEELGSETTVSLVLAGKRPLTREHIEKLSRRFHVSPAVFFSGRRDDKRST
jgi:HTH-type transcriptional regulator / antitoxin HigA